LISLKNIEVQREILANGGPDIGLAGDPRNHAAYNQAYDEYLKSGNTHQTRHDIGLFSERENAPPLPIKPMVTITEAGVMTMPKNNSTNIAYTDIWSFTSAFAQVIKLQNINALADFLPDFRESERNEFSIFYISDPINLAFSEHLSEFDILDNHVNNRIRGRFNLSNRCISHDEVKKHYPGWRVVSGTRGGNLEEQTIFRIDIDGFSYSFGFPEKSRNCLNSIGVGPV
jgi:hypothetical protein